MPPATSLATSLFARLRAETAEEHRQLEEELDPIRQFRVRSAYEAYLARALPFYVVAEEELSAFNWQSLGLDFAERCKSPLLRSDLCALHVGASTIGTPSAFKIPDFDTAVGAFYVLEGATLGGQVITRHLKALDFTPTHGGAFFNGYGARTGEMWKAFQAAVGPACMSPGQIDRAVAGAKIMFSRFAEWMRAAPSPS